MLPAVLFHATFLGIRVCRRNVIADLFQIVRIAHVHRAHAGVEPGDKYDALMINRRELCVGRVGAETGATGAKITAFLGHLKIPDPDRLGLMGNVHHKQHLGLFAAFAFDRLRHDENKVAHAASGALGECRYVHAEQRINAVHGLPFSGHQQRDLRRQQVLRRRLGRAGQQLLPVDDLQRAVADVAVAEVQAVALRSGRKRTVSISPPDAGRLGCARLLTRQPEVADQNGLRRIAQVKNLRDAPHLPIR